MSILSIDGHATYCRHCQDRDLLKTDMLDMIPQIREYTRATRVSYFALPIRRAILIVLFRQVGGLT